MIRHGELMERMRCFEGQYEFVLCAVNQVPPFDASLDWPKSIEGVAMEHYVAWMQSAYWITVTFRPAISVQAGLHRRGTAGRPPDRRALPRRLRHAAARARVRAGDWCGREAPGDRGRLKAGWSARASEDPAEAGPHVRVLRPTAHGPTAYGLQPDRLQPPASSLI
jgi:hypothetical protein